MDVVEILAREHTMSKRNIYYEAFHVASCDRRAGYNWPWCIPAATSRHAFVSDCRSNVLDQVREESVVPQ